MDDGQVIPEEIRLLLERRTTFQDWLTKLDQLGSEFRPEVTGKVRTDYESRLAEVQGELEGHRAVLETALQDRVAVVAEVETRRETRAAELEESELRYRVGEFADEDWERMRGEHQTALDELDAELNGQRQAVSSLEGVLGELAGSGAASMAAAAASVDEAVEVHDEVVVEPEVEPSADAGDAEPAVAEPWMSEPFEADDTAAEAAESVVEPELEAEPLEPVGELEAEFLAAEDFSEEAVAAEPEPPAEVEAEPAEPKEAGPSAEEPAEFMDELEFLESLSLEDAESFDAVSAMLDDEETEGAEEQKREDS